MIVRLRKVTDELFRGSAPSPKDVLWLKDNLGIKKIVSLDQLAGDKINRVCKLLNIKHIMVPIDIFDLKKTVSNFLHFNLKELLLDDGPTYVHCQAGKDRTGLAVALFKCKYMGVKPEEALEEAKSLGFGINVNPKMVNLFEKLIMNCKPSKDNNDADIVSNQREYISDNRDSYLDEAHQGSFAPYLSPTRQNPIDSVYNYINDQSPTRENFVSSKDEYLKDTQTDDKIPQVGLFYNDAGVRGMGPVEPVGGFIYD